MNGERDLNTLEPLMPPDAARRPQKLTLHGHTRVDDYYWLRERENPEVIAYLEAENAYTRQMLAHTEALQQTLYEEMVGRIQETDQSVPEQIDDYFYYWRVEEGQEYRIYCRKQGSLDAPEEVLLDLNELAEGHDYLNMGSFEVRPDHQILAYSLDTNGAEVYTVFFKDLRTGELLPDRIENTDYSAEWATDNRTFFYTTLDEARRSDKVWRHRLGTPAGDDDLLYHEEDELFRVYLYRTKDRRYIILLVRSLETAEAYYVPGNQPDLSFTLVQERTRGVRYEVEHHDERFFMVTNLEAPNFKLVTAPVAGPGMENWQTLVPHREEVMLDGIDLFKRYLVVYERENGLRSIRIADLQTDTWRTVEFPEVVYTYFENANPEFNTDLLRFTYQSLTTPDSVYDYDMATGARELKKQKAVKNYDPTVYRSERIFAMANDGARIPISLVYRADLHQAGQPMPCLLYGYGSYGYSIDPGFNSNRVSLLDRGFIWAIAHIRGGEDLGRAWYDQGKFLNKRNTFTDFIGCARHLIAEQYTTPDRLAIMGRSAGG
ncbi:MAG TPA: S9 family peptidase, partial [Candidatus Binatia bacterium]|nr:S9 family peptidase [Candidatus Binatia bacterium]